MSPRGRQPTAVFDESYTVPAIVTPRAEHAAEAHHEIHQDDGVPNEAHVTLRWGRRKLDIVCKAARLVGVPYQTYLKQATMQRVIDDLRAAREGPR